MTLARRIVLPSVLLGAVVGASVAYTAWSSLRETRALEHDTAAVRVASGLAYALDEAAQEEDREVLSASAGIDGEHEARLARASARVDEVMKQVQALPLAPRAAAIRADLVEGRAAIVASRDAIVRAARAGDAGGLARDVARWELVSARSGALLKDFTGYHLRVLDRTVAGLQERRAQSLRATSAAAAIGLLLLGILSVAWTRAVVRPMVAVAHAAERIAATHLPATVGGAERADEIGTLARAFNGMTERLLEANARLEEADRRKDDFLGMLSHELRNPLAPIRNSIHVLERAEPGSELAVRSREVVKRQVAHLTRLVDDLLDVTRIARGKIELRRDAVDVADLARRCGEDHAALMQERGLSFVVEAPDADALRIEGDATRLAQVLGNLLQNAVKFTPAGGRIRLAARRDRDVAELCVTDTGVGIPPELLPRVFEAFTQAEQSLARSDGGLGLGLAVVKGIVELHGGTVRAQSAGAGAGAEFVVRLPLAASDAAPGRSATS